MRAEVGRDLSDSAFDFQRVVWPRAKKLCRSGRIIPVENVVDREFELTLDQMAGIDAWQIVDKLGRMRGIASRIQWGPRAYDTFTVRRSRFNGSITEFQKRIEALEDTQAGWLLPSLTIQAYVSERRTGELLSVAVCATRDLYEYIRDGLEGWDYTTNQTSNASFYVVKWDELERDGIKIKIWSKQPRLILRRQAHNHGT